MLLQTSTHQKVSILTYLSKIILVPYAHTVKYKDNKIASIIDQSFRLTNKYVRRTDNKTFRAVTGKQGEGLTLGAEAWSGPIRLI